MIQPITTITSKEIRDKAVKRFRERGILLPTFAQMRNPELIPGTIKDKLRNTGLWDLDPVNLFRISWKNEPVEKGGLFKGVNYLVIPKEISGKIF